MTVPAAERSPARPAGAVAAAGAAAGRRLAVGVAVWAVLVLLAFEVGRPNRAEWKLRAAPLAGFVDRHVSLGTVVALVVGGVAVAVLPRWSQRVSWRALLLGAVAGAALWGGTLGLTRGVDGLERGLDNRHEYRAVIPEVDRLGVGRFVETFDDESVLRSYPIHVQGHPVGATLLFVGLDRAGLGGPLASSVVVVLLGATVAAAVLVALREVAGEDLARHAAPFVVLLPAWIWAATSADGVIAAVTAWGTAALVVASGRTGGVRSVWPLALVAGVAWGLAAHLSYGVVPAFLVGLVVLVVRRRWDLILPVAAGGITVVVAFSAAGFWWPAGLAATRIRYWEGIGGVRPYPYFAALGNPAAFALALGPAVAAAIAGVRDRRLWLLGGAGLAAAALANLSGMSKGEVERIWLLFAPWVALLAGGLVAAAPGRRTPGSTWPAVATALLASQVITAVAIESIVKTPW
jgi:methylthioxylose transferase